MGRPGISATTLTHAHASLHREATRNNGLVDSLRSALGKGEVQGDLRFQGGTESGNNYVQWGEGAYKYKPLPTVFRADEPKSQVREAGGSMAWHGKEQMPYGHVTCVHHGTGHMAKAIGSHMPHTAQPEASILT